MRHITLHPPVRLTALPSAARSLAAFLLTALLLVGCRPAAPETEGLSHARWLVMDDSTATVLSPWREGEVLHRYELKPYHRAVSATSMHAVLAERLGAGDDLLGLMDADYAIDSTLRRGLRDGRWADFGSSQSPNIERLKAAGCDLVFASPFENAGYGALESLGVPIVDCADYMETSPLGRAEWMRFYGRLLGRGAEADSIFATVEADYQRLAQSVDSTARQPLLLVGMRQGQTWYAPGGGSYMARLYDDAGFRYLFGSIGGAGSVPLDFETVYACARDAEVWLITYGGIEPLTYETLAEIDPRYATFRAYREQHVWVCPTYEVPYYDVLPFDPVTLLRDLQIIAQPARFPGERPQFFRPLR